MCKVMASQDAYFILLKFGFSWLLGGYKAKKWPKMLKNSVCVTPYLRNCPHVIVVFGTPVGDNLEIEGMPLLLLI